MNANATSIDDAGSVLGILFHDDLKALIPPLSADEFAQLEQNILADGIREPLVCWYTTTFGGARLLLDGHNRLAIAAQHRADCPGLLEEIAIQDMDFASVEDAKLWVIRNQLGRRNLTDFARGELALKMKPLLAAQAKERQGYRTDILQNFGECEPGRTVDNLADVAGVSHETIRKVERITEHAAPALIAAARVGDISIHTAATLAEAPPEEQAAAVAAGPGEARRAAQALRNHRTLGTGDNEWYTPPEYITAARAVLGGIDLDPASSDRAQRIVKASRHYTLVDDGLTLPWFGNVWLNPPYAQPAIQQFIDKAIAELPHLAAAIVLTHSYLDTKWCQTLLAHAQAVCVTRGRIAFIAPDGHRAAPTQGQAFFYFGQRVARFAEVFSVMGAVLIPLAARDCATSSVPVAPL